ncbi:hypothetical protein M5K25_017431 [Dendrobium thyrsiflorum]|uniref:Uncharacterized protein n=1 Tax=Dendrobium thyrsiflorum TaxID=117978 RepID=A0ABD0UMA4_DENTH
MKVGRTVVWRRRSEGSLSAKEVVRTIVGGQRRLERPLSGDGGRKDRYLATEVRSQRVMEVERIVIGRRRWSKRPLSGNGVGGPAKVRRKSVVWRKSEVNWWSDGSPSVTWWSDRSPMFVSGSTEVRASLGSPAEVQHQAVVQWNSGVRRCSNGSPSSVGGPAEVRRQAMVLGKFDVNRWSGGGPGVTWWSGESPMYVGGPVEVRTSLGGPAEVNPKMKRVQLDGGSSANSYSRSYRKEIGALEAIHLQVLLRFD